MSTATLPAAQAAQTPARKPPSEATTFRQRASSIASVLLADWVGEERCGEAVGRLSTALAASAASARDPSDFYACTPASIGNCIAIAALTGIMPGVGATALAYVVPQRARKGEAPQLQYMLSHRGLNALARRCGQVMIAVPIGMEDKLQSSGDGDVRIIHRDIDNPPVKFDELRGVMVMVKETRTGVVLFSGWMPRKMIEQRRSMSRSYNANNNNSSPWVTWPVEMAMKTSMHYAISRGWCVIDDTNATRALSADTVADLKEQDAPTGPANIGDVAALLGGQPIETTAGGGSAAASGVAADDAEGSGEAGESSDGSGDAGEAGGDAEEAEIDLEFRKDEKLADWHFRQSQSLKRANAAQLLDFRRFADQLHKNGQMADKRWKEFKAEIDLREKQIGESGREPGDEE